MFKSVAWLVAMLCLIQGRNGLAIDDLINELKPRLQEARTKISGVLSEGDQNIRDSYEAIHASISLLDKDLNQKRDELEESVNKAKSVAQGASKNIDPCVDQVNKGLSTWDRISLEKCGNRPELNRLRLKLAEVAKLEGTVATAVISCSIHNSLDIEKIKACVEERVADVEKQAEQAAKDIAATVTSDQEKANQCANDAASNLRAQLKTVGDDFSKCVKKS